MGWIKIKIKLLIGLLIVSLLINFVNGELAVENVEIEESQVYLDVDYHNFNDEDQEKISETTEQFTIRNNNAFNVSVLVAATGLPAEYSTESKEITIQGNSTQSVSLKVDVPHEEDAGEKEIGSIIIKGANDIQLDSTNLIQNTKSMLALTELEAKYTSKKEGLEQEDFDGDDNDYKLDKDVRVASEVILTFKMRNLFDKDYEADYSEIEDIKLTITTDDDNLFADDFEEEYELTDLEANKKEEFTVSFEVSNEATSGEYLLEIVLEGEDGKIAEYKIEKELTLEVGRVRDDVRIVTAEITPQNISICTQEFFLELELENFGTDNQKYAGASIYNEELDLNENWENVVLDDYSDDDNSQSKIFTFSLKEGLEAKSYPLNINVYVDKDEKVDFQQATLEISGCAAEEIEESQPEEEEEEEKKEIEVISSTLGTDQEEEQATTTSAKLLSSSAVVETIENSYTIEDFFVGIVIVAIVLVLAMIVTFFIILIK